jgi:hypothetical protein
MAGVQTDSGVGSNAITDQWDEIASSLNNQHDFELIPWAEGTVGPSDQYAFYLYGHTVMFMAGLHIPDGWDSSDPFDHMRFQDMIGFCHSAYDSVSHINQALPWLIDTNMNAYAMFLHEILNAKY